MNHHNPLCSVVHLLNTLTDAECDMMFEIGGEAAFNPFDESLADAIHELTYRAVDSVRDLSPRACHARLNLIWKDFVAEQRAKRAAV